jgi:acyl carrier protein
LEEIIAMTNLQKYTNAFITTFGVVEDKLAKLEYQSISEWDSVGHMSLVAELEEAFDIMLDTDDVIDFSSFEKGKEIVRKYGVEL